MEQRIFLGLAPIFTFLLGSLESDDVWSHFLE
jgi:hypothetical protein